jgi:hypothetical protein
MAKEPQWIFKDDIEHATLRLELLKQNFEYRKFFEEFEAWVKQEEPRFGTVPDFKKFGIRDFVPFPGYAKYSETKDICDPKKDIRDLPQDIVADIIPRLFYQNAVSCIQMKGQPVTTVFEGYRLELLQNVVAEGSAPFERVYKVDLRKRKSQIMEELERYIDGAISKQEQSKDNYYAWKQDKSRYRKEAWNHLKVWKLRKDKKSFSEIAKTLSISLDVAKKSFYRAFELTQNKQYDPEALRRDVWLVQKSELRKTCETCELRHSCDTLCPDMLLFVNQDQISRREKLFNDPDYVESLDLN